MPELGEFWIFLCVGFAAQLIDGALGMGYGVISSVVLLASGVPPAHTSASVHSAKLFTTAASGTSHLLHGNVDRRLFWLLSLTGVMGGVAGALFLTQVPGKVIRPYVFGYLLIMGLLILWRCWREGKERHVLPGGFVGPLGGVGGFLDAVGGGGWGPVVTSSLIGAGARPRQVVGTVNAAEFVVTCAVVAAFATTLLTGFWSEGEGLLDHLLPIAGLVLGGLPAAAVAGFLVKRAPRRAMTFAVAFLVIVLSSYELLRLGDIFTTPSAAQPTVSTPFIAGMAK
ncbi:sulfite exporter TauE/SafE family protein [Taklimakanibacter deserti]|uniref:sulfite exporter TauE/SafE family protein n=1 Tax=Taklimakanibacter deserti TaxID=2267839 RepID=UPI0034D506B0